MVFAFSFNTSSQQDKFNREIVDSSQQVIEENPTTIKNYLSSTTDFSAFVKMLKTTNSFDLLDSQDNFIVFAPTNEAFNKMPQAVINQLYQPENIQKLISIASYHIVRTNVDLEVALNRSNSNVYLNMLNGKFIEVELGSEEAIYIVDANGFTIDVENKVKLKNGVVYSVNEVLLPQVDVHDDVR